MLSLSVIVLFFPACDNDDDSPSGPDAGFLASSIDALGDTDLGGFTVPTVYDVDNGVFAPGAYNGQIRRLAQLQEIVDSSRNEPILWDIREAMTNEGLDKFASATAQGNSNLISKIDELNYDGDIGPVDQSISERFAEMADSMVMSSQANFTVTATNGTAGMITTGTTKRHVSAKGLEYIQLFEKGLYGAIFYDQMVDDYLRPSQSGAENAKGNNREANSANYDAQGTDRQHRFDEVFGYLGANPLTYPNASNTSNGDGSFIANYTFDFSDETEAAFGINLAQKLMDAFLFGRSVLKAGEGEFPNNESTNEDYYEAARADIKLYTELGLAAAAYHYLNDAIADITDEDKIHHLSEALAFIYALSFNSEGRLSATEAHAVLIALGWSSSDASLGGVYDINLWEVTDAQMQQAKDLLDNAYPGFGALPF
ncbi:MAG: DUF4856 domain-containing protein [Bacteroidota bacterium]